MKFLSIRCLIVVTSFVVPVAGSQAMLFGTDHSAPPAHLKEVWGLSGGRESKSYDVNQIATTVPSNVLWPGDSPTITFQIINKTDHEIRVPVKFETIPYALSTIPDKGDGMFAYDMRRAGASRWVKSSVSVAAKGWQNVSIRPDVPARFGGYAVILDVPGEGRKFAAGLVRALPQESRPIQYPTMSLDERDPLLLQRIGIRAIRYGIDYKPTTDPDFPRWLAEHRRKLAELKQHNVTVLTMIGAGGPQPLGQMRSFLNDRDEGPMGYPGDGAWLPSSDPDFRKFCRILCQDFGWPKGPVTALSLWNEPWEGSSISGWGADMPRYREMYRAMANGVLDGRKLGADVLVGGCDSSSNALDKLFPDEDRSFLPIFDFVSLHYQGLGSPQYIPFWRERKQGRVRLWDTESWAANTDERILPRLASWRAAGYDRLMGVDASNIADDWEVEVHLDGGKTERRQVNHAWSPAAAEGAVARFIGDRPFGRLLFGNGLPWAFTFVDPKKPDDGVIVLTGDIGAGTNGALHTVRLSRKGRLLVRSTTDFAVLDGSANPIAPVNGRYDIPLNQAGYYLVPSGKAGSFARLEKILLSSKIEGYEPVELVAKDMMAPIGRGAEIRVRLTNVLNRTVRGKVSVALQGKDLGSRSVVLRPGQPLEVPIPVRGVREKGDNRYAMVARFDGGADGSVVHREVMRCNVVSKRTIAIDGDLSDWAGAVPQTITDAKAQGPSQTEQAWYPFKSFDTSTKRGFAAAYLAYDRSGFYFAAKVADDTPDEGTLRVETRNDDQFYYPKVVYKIPRKGESGNREELVWPEGVRRYTYRKDPILPAGNGQGEFDNIQIAFNVIPDTDIRNKESYPYPKGTIPRYATYKDTDYEYALNPVAPQYGGGTEIWRLAAPGLPHKQFYPRQPKSKLEGPVRGGQLVVRRDGNTRVVECSIPWSEIPWVRKRLDAGLPIKFTYRVNDNKGPSYELAAGRSVSGTGGRTFHADWVQHWTNELEFGWGK